MQKNPSGFSPEDAKRIMQTPEGKQLLSLLQSADNRLLQDAAQKAAAGNMDEAGRMLAPLLHSEQLRALLRRLGR